MPTLLPPRILAIVTAGATLSFSSLPSATAQSADSWPTRPEPRLLTKVGLRLTHFNYTINQYSRQLVVPLSFGSEYRLSRRFSCYGQAEADVPIGRRGRGRAASPLPGASLGLGLRHYYRQASRPDSIPTCPYGSYVALEGNVDLATSLNRRGRGNVTNSTPSLYVYWGRQQRWCGHPLLFDVNAGLGLQAPARYSAERRSARVWDLATQVNLRIYFGRQVARP